jgi:hypothetical protein
MADFQRNGIAMKKKALTQPENGAIAWDRPEILNAFTAGWRGSLLGLCVFRPRVDTGEKSIKTGPIWRSIRTFT